MYVKAPMCLDCKHFHEEEETIFACAAFPKGIPLPIAHNRVKHTEPYPGDNGIQFEQEDFSSEKSSKGGPGSGNFGHVGRPGEVGGSAPTGTATIDPDVPTQDATDEQKAEQQAILDLKNRYGVTARHARMMYAMEQYVTTSRGNKWEAEKYWDTLDNWVEDENIPDDMVLLYKQSRIEGAFLGAQDKIPKSVFDGLEILDTVRGFQPKVRLLEDVSIQSFVEWVPPTSIDRNKVEMIGTGQTAEGYWHDGTTFYKVPKNSYANSKYNFSEDARKEVAIYDAFKDRMPMLPAALGTDDMAQELWPGEDQHTLSMSPYMPGLITGYDSIGEHRIRGLSDDLRARVILLDMGIANQDRHYGNVGFTHEGNLILIDSGFSLVYSKKEIESKGVPGHTKAYAQFIYNAFWRSSDSTFRVSKIDRRHIDYIVEGLKAIKGYDTTPGQALLNDIPEGTTWQQFFDNYLKEVYG